MWVSHWRRSWTVHHDGKVLSQDKNGTVIEAEVYGKGVLMWLMAQGRYVEILSPKVLREEMRQTLTEMLAYYKEKE